MSEFKILRTRCLLVLFDDIICITSEFKEPYAVSDHGTDYLRPFPDMSFKIPFDG